MEKRISIAIDGPAASGKSTTARAVADRLGYTFIDTGAMYRAVTLLALERGVAVDDAERVAALAAETEIAFRREKDRLRVLVAGRDITEAIRQPQVSRSIGPVADNLQVRQLLASQQRRLGEGGGVVMDGRDIGTVVLPNAELKIYMQATAAQRARRRCAELQERGVAADYQEVLAEIRSRDLEDKRRQHGGLRRAKDAVVIDTTRLSVAEQVEQIYRLARDRITSASCG